MQKKPVRVAIIDDDADDFHILKNILEDAPGSRYEIAWIPTSKQAIVALRQQTADVFLLDYRIDEKTGLDILEETKGLDLKSPIILLTGQGEPSIDIAAMEKGVADYLPKSYLSSETLERSIRYCIKRSQDREQMREIERVKLTLQAADSANQAKSQFLTTISHEIRTPLNAILGFAELARAKDLADGERECCLSIIQKNGAHLLELINDFLDLSKVSSGFLQVHNVYTNWRLILSEVIELLTPRANQKNIQLHLNIDPNIPTWLNTDPTRLRQIILNLVGNAIKFTDVGRITVDCHAERSDCESPLLLNIRIIDTGAGISLQDQKDLFRPFQQGSSSSARPEGGTGLGLDLSRKLAIALNGKLILERTKEFVGSTFLLSLPAQFSAGLCPTPSVSCNGAAAESETQNHADILLIDDAIDNQMLVQFYLKSSRYSLDLANSGETGIQLSREKEYDLILMDLQMPGMDGYETTQKLRAQGFTKPVIAFSAYSVLEMGDRAIEAGFSEYLQKPISKAKLLQTLDKIRVSTPPRLVTS